MSEISTWLANRYPKNDIGSTVIAHLETLWENFKPFSDRHFLSELCGGDEAKFLQRYWEMYLGTWLLERKFQLLPPRTEGPDIGVQIGAQRIFIEAIAPTPGTGADLVPKLEITPWKPGEAIGPAKEVPAQQIILRWTSAFYTKAQKFKEYREARLVEPTDACIIAINSFQSHFFGFDGISGYPAALEAVYPIGPRRVTFNLDDPTKSETDIAYRPHLQNANQALVSTTPFLESEFDYISAVMATHKGDSHMFDIPGRPIILVHNHRASAAIRLNEFPVDIEYSMNPIDDGLRIVETIHNAQHD